MKAKFDDYEKQSETYYSDMLQKFKLQAKEVVHKKQAQLDQLTAATKEKQDKIGRIKERMVVKSYKGLMSDEDDPDDEEE